MALRKRERDYDGRGSGPQSPGVQLAFRVEPDEVSQCYEQLVQKGVTILDPPADQPRGHRTVYFADPEGNILEVYAERVHSGICSGPDFLWNCNTSFQWCFVR